MTEAIGGVAKALFGGGEPDIPEAEVPAAPAPNKKEDTGAKVIVGADAVKDKRASGGGTTSSTTTSGDVLGGLGKGGGLSI